MFETMENIMILEAYLTSIGVNVASSALYDLLKN